MANKKVSVEAALDAYLTDYIRRTRGTSTGGVPGKQGIRKLQGLMTFVDEKGERARLNHLALMMFYFGTSLTSADLCAIQVGDIVQDGITRGIRSPLDPAESAATKMGAAPVWSYTWGAIAKRSLSTDPETVWPMRGSSQGGVALSGVAAFGDLGDPRTLIWLDDECAEILNILVSGLNDEAYIFSDDNHAPLTRDEVYERVDALPEALAEAGNMSHFFPIYSVDDYDVIPTVLRLNANSRFTGDGVTIAFIDSGFYPHPDLTEPENRIVAYRNIPEPHSVDFSTPHGSAWHGMQTSVSAAGNGYLSRGLYKGLASDSNVVLLRVSGPQGIETKHILEAFQWVAENRERYNIRVVNVSLGGGPPQSSRESDIDQAAEALVQMGIVVVVAAGNAGHSADPSISPPASAPSVITVGGVNDNNRLNFHDYEMYWSSYGFTVDGLLKPDLVAPGIWVAAPLLPGTPIAEEGLLLREIEAAPDSELVALIRSNKGQGGWPEGLVDAGPKAIRKEAKLRREKMKLVLSHYQHVDGTSFSAPLVCSVVAQMLQANPELTPRRVKELLVNTTDRLFRVPIERQGNGMIHPRKAVKEAINDLYRDGIRRPSSPFVFRKSVTFYFQSDDEAEVQSVAVAGAFNGWDAEAASLTLIEAPNLWAITVPLEDLGSIPYKFVVNGQDWIHDPENANREPDGYGGYNSLLVRLG